MKIIGNHSIKIHEYKLLLVRMCWNQLPAEVLGTLPCKLNTLEKRVRKAITKVN